MNKNDKTTARFCFTIHFVRLFEHRSLSHNITVVFRPIFFFFVRLRLKQKSRQPGGVNVRWIHVVRARSNTNLHVIRWTL